MKLAFDQSAWEDMQWWLFHDRETAKRIIKLIDAVMREPRSGIGKPEQLRGLGSEVWSRRITLEHRLVYVIEDEDITIQSCRHHY